MKSSLDTAKCFSYFLLYYLRSLAGQKRPLLGGIKLTHKCNLSCIHCPFHKKEIGSLTFEQVRASLTTLHNWGVRILIIEGGEPFLWHDGAYTLKEVVATAKRLFFSVGVTTNGTFPIEVDADVVWISVDGLQETHDRIRGRSFERIMANLAASTHPRIYTHTTINTLNWQELPEIMRFFARRAKGATVQFHYPYTENEKKLCLTPEQRHKAIDQLIEMKRQGLPIANSYASLKALRNNTWRCRPWMIASVDPDGTLTHGCYIKNRGDIACDQCGFSAHTEISLAYSGVIESILVGKRIFLPQTHQ